MMGVLLCVVSACKQQLSLLPNQNVGNILLQDLFSYLPTSSMVLSDNNDMT